MDPYFGQPPTVTPPCLPYWPIGESFSRKVRTKLNPLRKRHPDIPPAKLGGVEAALAILQNRTDGGDWRIGPPVGSDEFFGVYFEDGPVTWVFRPSGAFWSMRVNRGWQP